MNQRPLLHMLEDIILSVPVKEEIALSVHNRQEPRKAINKASEMLFCYDYRL